MEREPGKGSTFWIHLPAEATMALPPERADVRVLFMAGYTDDAIVYRGILDAGTRRPPPSRVSLPFFPLRQADR